MGALLILTSFFSAVLIGELLRRDKDAFMSIVVIVIVHGAFLAAMTVIVTVSAVIRPASMFLFWCGAFVFYFSARDLSENSILLRMVYLVKCHQPIASEKLFRAYESEFGVAFRVRKLKDAGLIKCRGSEFEVCGRGVSVLKLISMLTHFWKTGR